MRGALADYRLSLEGRDLSPLAGNPFSEILRDHFRATISPRLISLSLSEKRGGEADCLDIVLHDHDGKLEIPQPGAVLALQLGWARGSEVPIGLVDKGRFKVDEAEWSGPPDIVTIRARSADFASGFDRRRERSLVSRTLGEIVRDIAAGQGLAAQVDPALAGLAVEVLEQDELSDAALLRSLGRRFDAAATVKNGVLLFLSIGAGRTASGGALPAGTLSRASGDRYCYRRGERGQFEGVEARWHDRESGERRTVRSRDGEERGSAGKPPKRLRRTYHSENAARRAADGADAKMLRAAAEFEIDLAYGRPDLFPEQPLQVNGFKAEIDARRWLVAETDHTLDASGGLGTKLKLEAG